MRKQIFRDCVKFARDRNTPDSHPEWGNFHHYSFVIQRGKVIEWGVNRCGPPPIGYGYSRDFGKIHSETDAYKKAKGLLDPTHTFDIINIRLNKHGDLRMSKPCRCCTNFLRSMECSNVYFSTDVGFARLNLEDDDDDE